MRFTTWMLAAAVLAAGCDDGGEGGGGGGLDAGREDARVADAMLPDDVRIRPDTAYDRFGPEPPRDATAVDAAPGLDAEFDGAPIEDAAVDAAVDARAADAADAEAPDAAADAASTLDLGPDAAPDASPDAAPPPPAACGNDLDDDGDGRVDLADPGCVTVEDDDETDPAFPPACADGDDDDGDGSTDWPDDPECTAAGDLSEGRLCVTARLVAEVGEGAHALRVPVGGGASRAQGSCGGEAGEGVVAVSVNRPARLDVALRAEGRTPVVYVRGACELDGTEWACGRTFGAADFGVDRLPVGTTFVIVDSDFADGGPPIDLELTVTPLDAPACDNEADDDGDGLMDAEDPGCADALDDDEVDPAAPPACANGADDDLDGQIDWPNDPQCLAAGDPSEAPRCNDPTVPVIEVGPDGGVFTLPPRVAPSRTVASCGDVRAPETVFAVTLDRPASLRAELASEGFLNGRLSLRPLCDAAPQERACNPRTLFVDELTAGTWYVIAEVAADLAEPADATVTFTVEPFVRACSDGFDNDQDGLADAADPGCTTAFDRDEADGPAPPQCANEVDDDGDGAIDWPADPGCRAAGDVDERPLCILNVPLHAVSAPGGAVELPLANQGGLTDGSCRLTGEGREHVLAIDLAEPSNVTVDVPEPLEAVALYHRTACDVPLSETACERGDTLALRELPAGTHYVFVDPARPAPFTAQVTIDAAARACGNGVDDDDDGAVDAADPGCAHADDVDEADPPVAPACANGADDDGDGAVDWPDDLDCLAAGDDSEGGLCAGLTDVIEVDGSALLTIDLEGRDDLIEITCAGGGGGGERVIALTLDAPADVVVEAIHADFDTAIEVRGACDDPESVVACSDDEGFANRARVDLPGLGAGTWFVVVDAFLRNSGTTDVRISVER